MRLFNKTQVDTKKSHDEAELEDPTAPFNELESFNSIWQALRWKQIRTRVPICFKKTIRSRYMLANLVYLGYAIGILIIDFNPTVNELPSSSTNDSTETNDSIISTIYISVLDEPVDNIPLVNHLYTGK